MENLNTPAFWDKCFKEEYDAWRAGDYQKVRWEPFKFVSISTILPKPAGKITTVLDIGCGLGHLCRYLSAQDPLYIVSGTDFSPFAVETASRVCRGLFKEADAIKQPFDDRSFDAVIAADVIEHLSDIPAFLSEVQRVIKPGGTVIITTPERKASGEKWSEEHVTEFTKNGLINTMKQICDEHTFALPITVVQRDSGSSFTDPSIYYAGKVRHD